jgi:tripartite-type tricarboxylate transporter receptor subunit TctC
MSGNLRCGEACAVKLLWRSVAVLAVLTVVETACAQNYPARPVRLLHGFAVGGAIDIASRPLAQRLGEMFGQQVIVDAHPGAAGTIANEQVAQSTPDGYTLLAAPSSAMAATPHLYPLRYKPLADFAPVIPISEFSFVLVAHPDVPAKNAQGLIALAKTRPGTLTYGSPGVGTAFHLAGELFASMAGVKMLHVPYRGGGSAAIADILGGRVDLMWDNLGVVRPYTQNGRLRAIGVTGARRAAALPDVPTIGESGLPGYEMAGWLGVFAPAGTPRDIINTLNGAMAKVLAGADIRRMWATFDMEIAPTTPEQFTSRLHADYERYGRLIKSSGIEIQR